MIIFIPVWLKNSTHKTLEYNCLKGLVLNKFSDIPMNFFETIEKLQKFVKIGLTRLLI